MMIDVVTPTQTNALTKSPAVQDSALRIEKLRFRYEPTPKANGSPERWPVEVKDLKLAPGSQLLLTGGSGCGKSTLLHLIAGLIDPVEGTIHTGTCNLHSFRGATRDLYRGRLIGMIFQTFNLLHGFSAVENVMAALMFADPARFPHRGHQSHASGLLKTLGIDRPDADPSRMSIGQQQRIAVARAIACEPILVLADEPTASLDPENGAMAMDLIQSTCAKHNAALLCVSHDPAMATRFNHRLAMSELSQQSVSV